MLLSRDALSISDNVFLTDDITHLSKPWFKFIFLKKTIIKKKKKKKKKFIHKGYFLFQKKETTM